MSERKHQTAGMNTTWIQRVRAIVVAACTPQADENGTTMLEYAVILALISIAAVSVLQLITGDVFTAYQSVDDAILP